MANLIDALDKSVQRYEKRFSELMPDTASTPRFSGTMQTAPTSRNWMQMLGSGSAGLGWGQSMYGGGSSPGISWSAMAAGRSPSGPFDLSGFDDYQRIKAANDLKVQQQNGPGTATASKPLSDAPASWSGPATADDNKTLTAQQIDQWISSTRAASPLNGMGATILALANKYGVSAPLMLGIFLKESELGVTAGPNKVLSGIVAPSDPGLGGQRVFNGYASWEAAIDATAANLASDIYRGKSLQEQIGSWYVGPEEWKRNGLSATDKAGNGTVADYLNRFIMPTYAALGVTTNPTTAPTRSASPVPGGGNWQTAGAAMVGTPYGLGGRRAAGGKVAPGIPIDCSEFTAYLLEQEGITVTWNAQAQYNETQRVDRSQLQTGDLVFFQGTYDTGRGEYVTHVGRFIGYDKQGNPIMIHAGNGGVQYSNLNDAYWQQHYAGAGRVQRKVGGAGEGP